MAAMFPRCAVSARFVVAFAAALAATAVAGGCARFPAGTNSATGPQLIISMTVAGQINPTDFYFVVINNANDTTGTAGPTPVIAEPWGNGFVAGAATQFVEYNGSLPGDGYAVYQFIPGTNLQQFTAVSPPTQDTPVTTGSNTLEFRIPLSEVATSNIPASSITSLQINFINTNLLPVDSTNTFFPAGTKLFDALGSTPSSEVSGYFTISTTQGGSYSNSTLGTDDVAGGTLTALGGGAIQPYTQGDANNLDITSWSVQVSG